MQLDSKVGPPAQIRPVNVQDQGGPGFPQNFFILTVGEVQAGSEGAGTDEHWLGPLSKRHRTAIDFEPQVGEVPWGQLFGPVVRRQPVTTDVGPVHVSPDRVTGQLAGELLHPVTTEFELHNDGPLPGQLLGPLVSLQLVTCWQVPQQEPVLDEQENAFPLQTLVQRYALVGFVVHQFSVCGGLSTNGRQLYSE